MARPQITTGGRKKLPSSGDSIDTWVSCLTAETVDTVDTVFNQSNINVCKTQNGACSTATMITMARLIEDMFVGLGSNHKRIQRRSVYVWLTAFQYQVHEHARIHHSISLANWSSGNAFVDVARTSTK